MNNIYLDTELARLRREDALAHAEHERLMSANGLDLMSVLRRAARQVLARARLVGRPAPAELHLVSRAKLERRVDTAA